MTKVSDTVHKAKLERKQKRRDYEHRSTGEPLVLANISQKHQDYGMSPSEHLAAKMNRQNNS